MTRFFREHSFPSRGCFVRVVHPPAPSPCLRAEASAQACERRYRLRLPWAGLTPVASHPRLLSTDRGEPPGDESFPWGAAPGLPSSRCRPPRDGHPYASLPACHGLGSTPVELRRPRHGGRRNAGFPSLLPGLLPRLDIYGAISTFRRVRSALWPAGFPVYASVVPFPHPSAAGASGFMLFTRCLPRSSNGLADTPATLGNDRWLGFIISGLSPVEAPRFARRTTPMWRRALPKTSTTQKTMSDQSNTDQTRTLSRVDLPRLVRGLICWVTIRNKNGEIHGPRELGFWTNWERLGPVGKVLKVHARMRVATNGEPFDFVRVEAREPEPIRRSTRRLHDAWTAQMTKKRNSSANVRCGGTAAQEPESKEEADRRLPRMTCSASSSREFEFWWTVKRGALLRNQICKLTS